MSKRIVLALALGLTISTSAFAGQPSFKVNSSWVDFKGAISAESLSGAQEALEKQSRAVEKFAFVLTGVSDADIAAFAQAFPTIQKISINSKYVTNIAPLAGLTQLTNIILKAGKVQDLSPLANLVNLRTIEAEYDATGKDFSWMSKLTNLKEIDMEAEGASSAQGLPSLPNLRTITLNQINVPDLAPLAQAMPNLQSVNLRNATIGDVSALATLPNLKKVNLYGATVKDFTPLGKAPKLEEICYYAVKKADFSTLGALTQVETFDGGLTDLDSLACIKDMPKLESLRVFAEYVTDYTPLKNAPNIDYLHIWNMREPVGDLAFLAPLTNLRELKINGNKGVCNYEAIGNLAKLQYLNIDGNDAKEAPLVSFAFLPKLPELRTLSINKTYVEKLDLTGLATLHTISLTRLNIGENQAPFDLSAIKDVPGLQGLKLIECNVTNFGAMANLPKINNIDLRKTTGITDLTPLKAFTGLKNLYVSKGAFTKEQLAVLPSTVRVNQF